MLRTPSRAVPPSSCHASRSHSLRWPLITYCLRGTTKPLCMLLHMYPTAMVITPWLSYVVPPALSFTNARVARLFQLENIPHTDTKQPHEVRSCDCADLKKQHQKNKTADTAAQEQMRDRILRHKTQVCSRWIFPSKHLEISKKFISSS